MITLIKFSVKRGRVPLAVTHNASQIYNLLGSQAEGSKESSSKTQNRQLQDRRRES